jgi:hypothetical protein
MVPSGLNAAAPCNPPVLAKTFWADRRRSGMAVSVLAAMFTVWSAVEQRIVTRPMAHSPLSLGGGTR